MIINKSERNVDILRETIGEDERGIAQPANVIVISMACFTIVWDEQRFLRTHSPISTLRMLSS